PTLHRRPPAPAGLQRPQLRPLLKEGGGEEKRGRRRRESKQNHDRTQERIKKNIKKQTLNSLHPHHTGLLDAALTHTHTHTHKHTHTHTHTHTTPQNTNAQNKHHKTT